MRHPLVRLGLGLGLALAGLLPLTGLATPAGAASHAPIYGAAPVPGTGALTSGYTTLVGSMACADTGCVLGGYFSDEGGGHVAYVADEFDHVWHSAMAVPGIARLDRGIGSSVVTSACAPGRNCVVGGYYTDGAGNQQAFVANERAGHWQNASVVPGLNALNVTGYAGVSQMSCTGPGDCVAALYYNDAHWQTQAALASETNGVWAPATPVAGLAALNVAGGAEITALSCPASGQCTAAGYYTDVNDNQQVFVVRQVAGRWGPAQALVGLGSLNTKGNATVNGLSCTSASACVLAGTADTGFVATETNGVFTPAQPLALDPANGLTAPSVLQSLACESASECVVVGVANADTRQPVGFAVTETDGAWTTPQALPAPGLASATTSPASFLTPTAVACPSQTSCLVTGTYLDGSLTQPFVDQLNVSTWSAAAVPGLAQLAPLGVVIASSALACTSSGQCTVSGAYSTKNFVTAPYVANLSGPTLAAEATPTAPRLSVLVAPTGVVSTVVQATGPGADLVTGYIMYIDGHSMGFVATTMGQAVPYTIQADRGVHVITVRAVNSSGLGRPARTRITVR